MTLLGGGGEVAVERGEVCGVGELITK
jgi:hypothetical protein